MRRLGLLKNSNFLSCTSQFVPKFRDDVVRHYLVSIWKNKSHGISQNDFSEPLVYQLQGSGTKDWTVFVELVTNVNEKIFREVTISPNPTDGIFKIDNIKEVKVSIYNTLGKAFKIFDLQQNKNLVLINNLPEGVYFIRLEKNGQTETRKVVVL